MSTLVRSQLLNSLRASVMDLDERIALAERDIAELTFAAPRSLRADRHAILKRLADERDAIIARIEEAEEEYDLLWDLQCAISDATDIDGISDDALRSALKANGLVISRPPPKKAVVMQRCSDAEAYIIPVYSKGE